METTIAKITNNEEFTQVCNSLAELGKNPETARVSDKNELKMKIEVFIRKIITDYTKDTVDMTVLFEFVMIMDKDLPWKEFFHEHGTELFTMFFKLTYYGKDIWYSVENPNGEIIDDHDSLEWVVCN